MNWENIFYIQSAGFYFKLVFTPWKPKNNKGFTNLNLLIQEYFNPNLINIAPNNFHTVVFEQKTPFFITRPQKNKSESHYLLFASKKESTTYTYQHISLSQFFYLFIDIIHDLLVKNHGFIIHASSVIYENKAYIFTAKPGGGKTTTAQKIVKNTRQFSDDALIIRKIKNKYWCFQPPFDSKMNYHKDPLGYKVAGIFFVKKNKPFKISPVEPTERNFKSLVQQVWTKKITGKEVKDVLNFFKKNKFFFLERNLRGISPSLLSTYIAQAGPRQ